MNVRELASKTNFETTKSFIQNLGKMRIDESAEKISVKKFGISQKIPYKMQDYFGKVANSKKEEWLSCGMSGLVVK